MPGLTLLNIDRQGTLHNNPIDEIKEVIEEIESFISTIPNDAQPVRLVPLKMKLRRLQDAVSQFGTQGEIDVEEKQSMIMELHPELQLLTNRVAKYGGNFSTLIEICMNFLLNHLCSTAASDPRSTVIGVSNVMAQVLSSDVQTIKKPDLNLNPKDLKYFDEFALIFNSMLTTAGLFSAPILGLPNIPISALGAWADQALSQFSVINEFVADHFNPRTFYRIDQSAKAIPFDTTTDILSFYIYENEFLAALIARADLLSGLEFPGGFTESGQPKTLQSVEEITKLLAESIRRNCESILDHMKQIDEMFTSGFINRNERPEDYLHLMSFREEATIWMNIAELADLLIEIFDINHGEESNLSLDVRNHYATVEKMPPNKAETIYQTKLYLILNSIYENLFTMFPRAQYDTNLFIQSSEFTKFREYLQYVIHIVAAHDLLLDSEEAWTPWLLAQLGGYFTGDAIKYNPIGALEAGILSTLLGFITENDVIMMKGMAIIDEVKPYLEFQHHHILTLNILEVLIEGYENNRSILVKEITEQVMEFLDEMQINPVSMLFQRANLYLGMLSMYNEEGDYLRKENERYVAFDPFSWIQVPKRLNLNFPYMPLNTNIDNLNSN